MRVIAGENRGRILKMFGGPATRPTTDKVKEAIFDMIGPFFEGGNALDLYAGSGALGLEALSRGAASCVFVDKASAACQIIRENVSRCRYQDRSRIYRLDAKRALERLAESRIRFDYVFLDPPYARQQLIRDVGFMTETGLLEEQAIVVVEHDERVRLPDAFTPSLARSRFRTFHGKTAISIYRSDA